MGIPPSLAAGFPTAGNYYSTENRQCKESNGVEFLFIRRKQKAAWSKMKKISKRLLASALAGVMVTSFGGCSFKDNDAKSLNNESVSQAEDKVYTEDSLENCYMLKYTNVRGGKTTIAVEIIGSDVYQLIDGEHLYNSKYMNDEDILEDYFEKFGTDGEYDSLISYLRSDYGVKSSYTLSEIKDSVNITKYESVLSKK